MGARITVGGFQGSGGGEVERYQEGGEEGLRIARTVDYERRRSNCCLCRVRVSVKGVLRTPQCYFNELILVRIRSEALMSAFIMAKDRKSFGIV